MTILLFCWWCLLCVLSFTLKISVVNAREVKETHEWTSLGEHDTITVGMHVCMDMTTVEEWVKLPDNDNLQDDSSIQVAAAATSNVQNDHLSTLQLAAKEQKKEIVADGNVVTVVSSSSKNKAAAYCLNRSWIVYKTP